MFPAFIQNIKCCFRRVLLQPCYSSQSLLPHMQVSIIVADSHALQVCLIDWQSLAGSWCLQCVTSKKVNTTWAKKCKSQKQKRLHMNIMPSWTKKSKMHWRHSLWKSTHQTAATSSSHQCTRPEGECARNKRRTPPQYVSASCKSDAPQHCSAACIQRWCHHSSLPSQAKVHEATPPATNILKKRKSL